MKYYFMEEKKRKSVLNYIPTGHMIDDSLTNLLALDLFKTNVKIKGISMS